MILQAIFGLIKAPHRKPTTSQNKACKEPTKSQSRAYQSQIPNMSPRWMMDSEFDFDGYEYYNTEDENDDAFYYAKNEESKCVICMGGSYIRTIYINYSDYDDYDDTNDY